MWVRRIIRHIKEVIRLEGGNEYREGGHDVQRRYTGKSATPFSDAEDSDYETEPDMPDSDRVQELLQGGRGPGRRRGSTYSIQSGFDLGTEYIM